MQKKILTLAVLLCSLFAVADAVAQPAVILSELCDPRVNYLTDRFIEIYNAGPVSVDLTGWQIVAVGNGGDIFTWPLSGSILPGQALVAGDATTTASFQVDFAQAAWSDNLSTWNGKVGDGAKLLDATSAVVDYMVADTTRFENMDYVRNPDVTAPSSTYSPAQWTGTAVDLATEGSPGSHTVQSSTPVPEITGLRTDPATPGFAETVDVLAEIVDLQATITSAQAVWGLSSGSLPNSIAMTVSAGNTYRTVTPIPAQVAGATVFYRVEATNDQGGIANSATSNFDVPFFLTLAQVQGSTSTSPYDGQAVSTEGVVSARFANYYVLQNGDTAWNGLWVSGAQIPAVGDFVEVSGLVDESPGGGFDGTTLLRDTVVLTAVAGSPVPLPVGLSTGTAGTEAFEGLRVRIPLGTCTDADVGNGAWLIDDGSGPVRVGSLGFAASATLGTRYEVTGAVAYVDGAFTLEPEDVGDVAFVADDFAPVLEGVSTPTNISVEVGFSEPVDLVTGQNVANYSVSGVTVLDAQRSVADPSVVVLTVSAMANGGHTLTVNGIADLYGNVAGVQVLPFDFVDINVPPGYYNGTEGLYGDALRTVLHAIIDNHSVQSYTYLWTAFYSTDAKDNGKVWDMYSDVPGGIPPYEYTFGVDQVGSGAAEGFGYNREHSWPKSWYGGEISPMYTDLFVVIPSDTYMNSIRGNYPYGEVGTPTYVSMNGSLRGSCVTPGYTGVVFEPIDDFKGDVARNYFYMSTRYYGEDGSWPGSDMTDGADMLPWALDMMLRWHEDDPVSRKEIERNQAVYLIQNNRNPYIDNPEFVARVFVTSTDVETPRRTRAALFPVAPNPFNPSTTIRFELPSEMSISMKVYDAAGRHVKTLIDEQAFVAGPHERTWNGRDSQDRGVATGVYFVQLRAGNDRLTQRMVLVK